MQEYEDDGLSMEMGAEALTQLRAKSTSPVSQQKLQGSALQATRRTSLGELQMRAVCYQGA